MTTPEVASQLAESEKHLTPGTGPLQGGDITAPPQSLVDKHHNLAATALAETPPTNQEPVQIQTRTSRVFSTGARTPGSLATEIQAQVDQNEARASSRDSSQIEKHETPGKK
ncbi:hypothetical protein K4F52_009298 [Lecanicillium sp. MT-2017a]|nr:hypothetical protein K4F52_009298 [Lecanicillium sp. MT-2017a]